MGAQRSRKDQNYILLSRIFVHLSVLVPRFSSAGYPFMLLFLQAALFRLSPEKWLLFQNLHHKQVNIWWKCFAAWFQDARTMTFSNNMPLFRFTMGKNIPERTCAPPAEEVLSLSGYVLQCSGPLQWLPQECRVQWSDVSAREPGHFTTCTWGSQVVSANVSWSYVCGKSRTDIMSLKIQMTQLI